MKLYLHHAALFCAATFLASFAYGQEDTGSVQLGYSQSRLSDNFPGWRDAFARGNVNLGKKIGVLNWEASQQKHFDETGQAVSASLTHDFSEDWYAMVGAGLGTGASFLTKRRIDLALNRKWLAQRQLVTGVQFTASKASDGVHDDRSWQVSSSYYFAAPFVGELGFKRNTSNPGSVSTNRYYVAGTYGESKKHYLSARYDTGREGYLPQGANVPAANFKSNVTTLTWRQWLSRSWGFELQAERYHNPFYRRNGVSASVFYDF